MWVMITGITRVEDALMAWNMGVDALGLLVEQGDDFQVGFISPKTAASITKHLPLGTKKPLVREIVLTTHFTDVQKIISLVKITGARTIQLVENITPEEVNYIKGIFPDITVIKSLLILDTIEIDAVDTTANTFDKKGKTYDWDISKKIVHEYRQKVPIILAGGLGSENIRKSIQIIKTPDVDTSLGIRHQENINAKDESLTKFLSKAKYFSTNGSTFDP